MSKKRRLGIALAAGALVAAMLPGVASADTTCPPTAVNPPPPGTVKPSGKPAAGWLLGVLDGHANEHNTAAVLRGHLCF